VGQGQETLLPSMLTILLDYHLFHVKASHCLRRFTGHDDSYPRMLAIGPSLHGLPGRDHKTSCAEANRTHGKNSTFTHGPWQRRLTSILLCAPQFCTLSDQFLFSLAIPNRLSIPLRQGARGIALRSHSPFEGQILDHPRPGRHGHGSRSQRPGFCHAHPLRAPQEPQRGVTHPFTRRPLAEASLQPAACAPHLAV
jgi:hypothetical protein